MTDMVPQDVLRNHHEICCSERVTERKDHPAFVPRRGDATEVVIGLLAGVRIELPRGIDALP